MQDRDQSYLDRFERIRRGDQGSMRQDQMVVTRIPIQTSGESYWASSPHQDVYRQALRVILETPQIERRLNYITAGMIITILGGWLTGSVVKSRAFTTLTGSLLFFCGTALVGLLVGIMLGEGFIPKESVPVLLFATVGILIFVLAALLGSMLLQSAPVD
jgi:hypothetical protein